MVGKEADFVPLAAPTAPCPLALTRGGVAVCCAEVRGFGDGVVPEVGAGSSLISVTPPEARAFGEGAVLD